MSRKAAFALFGFGLGGLILSAIRSAPPRGMTPLKAQAIEAQRDAERAAKIARDLAARVAAEENK